MEMSYVTHLQHFHKRYLHSRHNKHKYWTTLCQNKNKPTVVRVSLYWQLKTAQHLTVQLTTAQQELSWCHVAYQTKGVVYQLLFK
jgi:hypothetical protein